MRWFKHLKKKTIDYLFDHPIQREILNNAKYIIVTCISAFIFAFGFKCFIQPNYDAVAQIGEASENFVQNLEIKTLASCGASGISQIFISLLKICGVTYLTDNFYFNLTYWALYVLVNVPLFFLGFFKVGKKFAIYTLLNVILTFVFGILLPNSSPDDIINQITFALGTDVFARVAFGALTTGIASSLAYIINSTAGGIDIIAFYIGERKGVTIGKWSALINVIVVGTFSILSTIPLKQDFIDHEMGSVAVSTAFVIFIYMVFYMIFTSVVVDTLNTKNKKVELQIFTAYENLSQIIIANVPHGCTIIPGKGGYTGNNVYVIYVSVSKRETKQVVKVCREADPKCFINVLPMNQVFGRFFKHPIE